MDNKIDKQLIIPLEGDFDKITSSVVQSRPNQKHCKMNKLHENNAVLGPAYEQLELFHVEKQVERDGIEMGVLENGIAYLSESGLARMAGIDRKVLNRFAIGWKEERKKPRGAAIAKILEKSGYLEDFLYLKSEHNGTEINAYPEPVCLAILEYYAFEAEEKREEALATFRQLARVSLSVWIYQSVGYVPQQQILDSWQHFHDRLDMTLDAVPLGYFSVFREIASMIVPMIRSGVIISDKVVPDISVGKTWSQYWKEQELEAKYGERVRYNHEYPDYYPQAKTNPQPAFAYPDGALGEFRAWLRNNYILNKFSKYLLGQNKKGNLKIETVNKVIGTFVPKELENN